MSRRLVVVTPFAVHPPTHGGKLRLHGLLRHLGRGWEVESWAQIVPRRELPRPARTVRVSERWVEHRLWDVPSTFWFAAAGRLGLPAAGASALLALAPRRSLRHALARADVVMVASPYQLDWVRRAVPRDTPLVLDAHNVEADLRPAGVAGWRGRAWDRVAAIERRAWAAVDLALATSEEEAAQLRRAGVPEVLVIPNAVDVERIRPATGAQRRDARLRLGLPVEGLLALFVGSAHSPNRDAVGVIESQAGALRRLGLSVLVVGRVGIGRAAVPGVRLVGEVDDTLPWLHAADIALCPLLAGAGTSLKVAEYLAAGLPLVTTPVGVRGLAVRSGHEADIRTADGLAEGVSILAGDAALRATMGAAARRFAEEHLGWSTPAAAVSQALDRLAAGRPRREARR